MADQLRYAVISGEIRDEFDFLVTLSKVVDLRDSGFIAGIVVSTWDSQVNTALENRLRTLGVPVVRYPGSFLDPSDRDAQAVYLRQAKLFLNGLRLIPDDAYVFRIRTDRSLDELGRALEPAGGNGYSLPEGKVAVHIGGSQARIIEMPFSFSDFTFYGPKLGLQRMVILESSFHLLDRHIVTNSMWFVGPYLHSSPTIRDWYYYVDTWILRSAMQRIGWDKIGDWPSAFIDLIAEYFVILDRDFYFVPDAASAGLHSFEEAIASGTWTTGLTLLLEGGASQSTANYQRFLEAVQVARSSGIGPITAESHDELVKFGELHFPEHNGRWIRPFLHPPTAFRSTDKSVADAPKVLFEGAGSRVLEYVAGAQKNYEIRDVTSTLAPRDGRYFYLALAAEARGRAELAPQLSKILAEKDWDTVLRGHEVASQVENMLRQQLNHRFNLHVAFYLLAYYQNNPDRSDFHGIPHPDKAKTLVVDLVAKRLGTRLRWNDEVSAIENYRLQLATHRSNVRDSPSMAKLDAIAEIVDAWQPVYFS